MSSAPGVFGGSNWQERLDIIVETMREMSRQTDPQRMVRAYTKRMQGLMQWDRVISVSRRELARPWFRVTRDSWWKEEINPWRQKDRLPLLSGGLVAELLYGDAPRIIDDFEAPADDPAYDFLAGQRSLMAIPHYDRGESMNMTLFMRNARVAFPREQLPEMVWMANLFGRATHNLVLREELREAYELVDHELKAVADIQRSLLPADLPEIPTMRLAARYETSRRAGGDYYDFFPLPDGRWGILIADVSGHGIPAAVMMAITHSIAHTPPASADEPAGLLRFLNGRLTERYTLDGGTFVTAFYGTYDPASRELVYANAGHVPPRLKRCDDGTVRPIDGIHGLPLGVRTDEPYEQSEHRLRGGDQIVLYTDGITEAFSPAGDLFGVGRLDEALGRCRDDAYELIENVLESLERFTHGQPATDDRTILVAKIS